MNWSNSSGIHRVDPGADTKDGVTIVPGADGGKSWRRAGGNGGVAVGRGSRAALSAELWKIRTIPRNRVCVRKREKEGEEGKKGRAREGETPTAGL